MPTEGVITAIVTPFDENFNIDYKAFESLVSRQVSAGIDGILIGGSTGEGSLISDVEFNALLEIADSLTKGKASLFAGCSSPSTAYSVARAKIAKRFNVEALLTTAPYYVKPVIGGIFLHLETIAKSADLPILFYDNPGRSGISLNRFQLQNILDQPYILGIKDSSKNLEQLQSLSFREGQILYCGDDGLTIPFMSIGARGSISVISNLLPAEYKEIVHLSLQNRIDEARILWKKYHSLIDPLFKEGNPSGIKSALSLCGISSPFLRPPLLPVSKGTLADLERVLSEIGALAAVEEF